VVYSIDRYGLFASDGESNIKYSIPAGSDAVTSSFERSAIQSVSPIADRTFVSPAALNIIAFHPASYDDELQSSFSAVIEYVPLDAHPVKCDTSVVSKEDLYASAATTFSTKSVPDWSAFPFTKSVHALIVRLLRSIGMATNVRITMNEPPERACPTRIVVVAVFVAVAWFRAVR
jgi:hypothetical protein